MSHPLFLRSRPARLGVALTALGLLAAAPQPAQAQWSTAYEQFYLQASHNWQFRNRYAHADRLFNAFDYGHAVLYETLWTKPDAPASELEDRLYRHLTQRVLTRPPRVPLEEGAIEIRYAQLAPEAKVMFDWAHILHRQLYDVLADERRSAPEKDAEVARLVAYYRTRGDVAFSSKPKSMALMQEQPYSLAFRQKYPKFNGLIWGYHWLQVGLYEPLVVGRTVDEKQSGIRATVSRFWQMLGDAPNTLPHQMPMTAAVAPAFAARYPEAAIIFDNLHSMHDVVSDILTNPSVPRDRKRAEILRAARLFRDDTSYVMPVAAWRVMSEQMGAENMGGPAVGFLPALPTPSVTYGAVMTHDQQTGAMTGFKSGSGVGGAHAHHDMAAMAPAAAAVPAAHIHGEGTTVADSAQVVALINQLHTSLAAGDSAAVLGLFTGEALIVESGEVQNLATYRREHLPADVAYAKSLPATRGTPQVIVRGDVAYATNTSATKGTYRDRAVDAVGAELVVAQRTAAGWRISAIHWSSRRR